MNHKKNISTNNITWKLFKTAFYAMQNSGWFIKNITVFVLAIVQWHQWRTVMCRQWVNKERVNNMYCMPDFYKCTNMVYSGIPLQRQTLRAKPKWPLQMGKFSKKTWWYKWPVATFREGCALLRGWPLYRG